LLTLLLNKAFNSPGLTVSERGRQAALGANGGAVEAGSSGASAASRPSGAPRARERASTRAAALRTKHPGWVLREGCLDRDRRRGLFVLNSDFDFDTKEGAR
jgi:hypothetical protein